MPMIKKLMLVLWCVFSLGWLFYAGQLCKVPDAYDTYHRYYAIVDSIQNKEANDYDRREFMSYDRYLESAGKNFAAFLFLGFGLPGLLLSGGTWLFRDKKPKSPKKPAPRPRR